MLNKLSRTGHPLNQLEREEKGLRTVRPMRAESIRFSRALAFTEFAKGRLGPETLGEMFFVGR